MLLTISYLAGASVAAPAPAQAVGQPQSKQLLDAATIQEIKSYMPLLSIADCIGATGGLVVPSPSTSTKSTTPSAWSCTQCSTYPSMKLENIWNGRRIYDATAFLGVDDSQKKIYLMFRGSVDIQDVLADISVSMLPAPDFGGSGAKVHAGFYAAYRQSKNIIMPQVLSAFKSNPDYTLVVGGHSLGGALAALYALALSKSVPASNLSTVTAGQPTVGNMAFAQYATNQLKNMYRCARKGDYIAKLPFWNGYTQMGHEIYLEDYTKNLVYSCSGIENPACSWGDPLQYISGRHLDYFETLGCY